MQKASCALPFVPDVVRRGNDMSKQIDRDRKICYVKAMGRRKVVFCLSLFIVFSYIVTPLVDSLACTECLGPLQLTVNKSNIEHSQLTHVHLSWSIPAGNTDILNNGGARSFCAICAHVSGPSPLYCQAMSLSSVFIEPEHRATAPVSPRYSIYHPPEVV